MDLISTINFEIARIPNLKELDPRQIPCIYCRHDIFGWNELMQVMSLLKDNSNFTKDLVATYHTLLHTDTASAEYFKDTKTVMAVKILAGRVKGRDGDRKDNLIYKMCIHVIKKVSSFKISFHPYLSGTLLLRDEWQTAGFAGGG